MSERIIAAERSVMVAADVEPERFEPLIRSVGRVAGLSSWKIGFEVGLGLGLPAAVYTVKNANPEAVVVYDHQKGGNDIPKTGMNFARAMTRARVDAAILFPFTGWTVEDRWVKELQDAHVGVIVGAEMTHDGFLYSEGGRIADDRLEDMFEQAIELGVTNFVVPGNKPSSIGKYRKLFRDELGDGNYDLYSPGFVDQGGNISEAAAMAGRRWHAILGSAIYEAESPRQATAGYARQVTGV